MHHHKNESFCSSAWKTALSSNEGQFDTLLPQSTPRFSLGSQLLGEDEVRTENPLIVVTQA